MAQKIFFYEGDSILNELDIKRIFKTTNIELQSRYIFCILFDDFPSAFEWMTSIAFYAERENHHPEWLNVYNKVDVILTTHDAGGVSKLDIDLAKKMELQFKK